MPEFKVCKPPVSAARDAEWGPLHPPRAALHLGSPVRRLFYSPRARSPLPGGPPLTPRPPAAAFIPCPPGRLGPRARPQGQPGDGFCCLGGPRRDHQHRDTHRQGRRPAQVNSRPARGSPSLSDAFVAVPARQAAPSQPNKRPLRGAARRCSGGGASVALLRMACHALAPRLSVDIAAFLLLTAAAAQGRPGPSTSAQRGWRPGTHTCMPAASSCKHRCAWRGACLFSVAAAFRLNHPNRLYVVLLFLAPEMHHIPAYPRPRHPSPGVGRRVRASPPSPALFCPRSPPVRPAPCAARRPGWDRAARQRRG
jgi:hypothetical protein